MMTPARDVVVTFRPHKRSETGEFVEYKRL